MAYSTKYKEKLSHYIKSKIPLVTGFAKHFGNAIFFDESNITMLKKQ